MDFSTLLSSAVDNINSILTALVSLLAVASGIWIGGLIWRLFCHCTDNVVTDADGFPEDFEKANEGIMFDGDPSDQDAIDEFMAEAEQRYRDYITTDDE